jgi:hypothetical protein
VFAKCWNSNELCELGLGMYHLSLSFVIAMEILPWLMEEVSRNVNALSFHLRYTEIKLTHLCFADDLRTNFLNGKNVSCSEH